MKVCHEGFHYFELEAGIDEQPGRRWAVGSAQALSGGLDKRSRFQRACRRSSYRDDSSLVKERGVDSGGSFFADLVDLGFDGVIFYSIYPHRLKSTIADVQSDLDYFHADFTNRIKERRSEMKSGRRRGDRASFLREHGLISLCIETVLFIALYIRRQWRPSDPVDDAVEVIGGFEPHDASAALTPFENFSRQLSTGELDSRARQKRPARLD